MSLAPTLPMDHPARRALNAEMHARPPEALPGSARISFMALTDTHDIEPVAELCRMFGVEPPAPGASHVSVSLGGFQLKWERHTEFVRYKFIVAADPESAPFTQSALEVVPPDWLARLPGKLIVASHVEIRPAPAARLSADELSQAYFSGNAVIGSAVAGGTGSAFTDFHIGPDGFGRMLLYDGGMTPRQRGRTVQRLVEVDAYCMMALLTFPVARDTMARLSGFEGTLDEITAGMRNASKEDEPGLLDRLTKLHADLVREQTATQFRFSAAKAYSELVSYRLGELREQRMEGIQTFREFMARRLDPAMRTCEAAAKRLVTVSGNISHATQLLQTRVDVTREEQNQALLESMDRRAHLQLRLQETVEGLSMAAITYYIVGLIGYAAAGLYAAGYLPVDKQVAVMAAIPVVLVLVGWALKRARARMQG